MCCWGLCANTGYARRVVNPDIWGSRLSDAQTGLSHGACRAGYCSRPSGRDLDASGAIDERR